MKHVGAISTVILSMSIGVGVPAYAQQEQHDQQEERKDKPAQEKEKKAQPDKQAKQEETNARQEDKNTKPEEKNARQEKNTAPEERNAQQEKNNRNEKNAQQEKNSQEEKNAREQHPQEAKPGTQEEHARGNGGGRIPEDRFRTNFGREHRFHVNQADYSRDRRFQYGGYWFGFVDPWPSNWLYTQDVFVVEIDGVYYLCNASYPGVNIALSVAM